MINKISFSLLFILMTMGLFSQNFQVHYDLGKDRKYITTTVELFKPDNWGNTFLFVDFDYNVNDVKGVSMAYMEIARGIRFWDNPFALQIEYNGGFGRYRMGENAYGSYGINDAWLGGVQYTWSTSDFSRVFTLQGLYKYIRGKHNNAWQITGVWVVHLLENRISLTGFADFWRETNYYGFPDIETTDYVFLAEPQIWYNFGKHFSAGTEIELSNNFAGNKGFMINPTVAVKWTF
jgi:hypothetical protein